MIVPDVNLLIYAVDSRSAHHSAASAWWTGALLGSERIGMPWMTSLAFLRLTTNPRVFERPLTVARALDLVEAWESHRQVVLIEPTQRHLPILRGLLLEAGTAGNLVTDAHLAALTVEHGATLCSADNDFARFRGLRWINPLAADGQTARTGRV